MGNGDLQRGGGDWEGRHRKVAPAGGAGTFLQFQNEKTDGEGGGGGLTLPSNEEAGKSRRGVDESRERRPAWKQRPKDEEAERSWGVRTRESQTGGHPEG